jgi:hypothetical protein
MCQLYFRSLSLQYIRVNCFVSCEVGNWRKCTELVQIILMNGVCRTENWWVLWVTVSVVSDSECCEWQWVLSVTVSVVSDGKFWWCSLQQTLKILQTKFQKKVELYKMWGRRKGKKGSIKISDIPIFEISLQRKKWKFYIPDYTVVIVCIL